MEIEKGGVTYQVREYSKSWTISTKTGGVTLNIKISKTDCPTFDDLKAFFAKTELS